MAGNLNWLDIPTAVASLGDEKSDLINAQRGSFDAALTEVYTLATDSSESITAAVFEENIAFQFPSANTATQDLTIPSGSARLFTVVNSSSFNCTVTNGTTSLTVEAQTGEVFYAGAGANELFNVTPKISEAYRAHTINVYANGAYTSNEVIAQYAFTVEAEIPSSMTNSIFKVETAPTGAISFDVQKNGSSIGTIDFAASATDATFTFASAVTFNASDVLSIVAPASVDGTLAGLHGVIESETAL